MRILIVHNFYGSESPSGENKVVEMERQMLESYGHTVELFTRQSDEIRVQGLWGILKGALATVWNPWMARDIRKKVEVFQPDIVHVHNTFPLISPSIFSAIGMRAKRVLTLHNYRTVCPAAIPMRKGKVCTHCMDKKGVWPAIRYGCYRNSRLATLPLAMNVALHRALGTWQNHVDAFITLSDFQRQKMADVGFPEAKMFVKPNFLSGSPQVRAWAEKESAIVFAGRLSAEKGVRTLIDAWKLWGEYAPELRVIGDGPLRNELKSCIKGSSVRFLGQLTRQETQQEIAKAKLLVLPSEWYETFGMAVIEAFAQGTPVAAANIGALPSIVREDQTGVLFPPANPQRLYEVVCALWQDNDKLRQLGLNAQKEFEEKYTEDSNYAQLMAIYEQTINVKKEIK